MSLVPSIHTWEEHFLSQEVKEGIDNYIKELATLTSICEFGHSLITDGAACRKHDFSLPERQLGKNL